MIAIIDYGAGNLGSVTRAFDLLGADYRVVDSGAALTALKPKGIVLPGVGAFGPAVDKLKKSGFFSLLKENIAREVPFLGICLGMQLLMEGSLEAPGVTGLGIFPGLCQRFSAGKVPQMGWNRLIQNSESPLFRNVSAQAFFYFIHSYYIAPITGWKNFHTAESNYYQPFISAIASGKVCGVQFHPEKSGTAGLQVLDNWLNLVGEVRTPYEIPPYSSPQAPLERPESLFFRKTTRIIPCLDVENGRVVKGVKFKEIRDAGDPEVLAQQYSRDGADEITFLDIGATYQSRRILLDVVQRVSRQVFVPLCVGGGIGSVEEIREVLQAGADKVSVCSAALRDPQLLARGANQFGSQCIVLSIDAGRVGNQYHAFLNGGRIDSGIEVLAWAQKAQELGAGEILLNSIDQDGTQQGYDLELTARVSEAVTIPVIASGGAGTLPHLLAALNTGKADAILLASLLHDNQLNLKDIKTYLKKEGVTLRW